MTAVSLYGKENLLVITDTSGRTVASQHYYIILKYLIQAKNTTILFLIP